MFGNNPKRPPQSGDGTWLDIQDIFPTLQGEGPFAGHPSIFIRLGGCNLACSFCDTEFESFKSQSLTKILEKILLYSAGKKPLIVITGGEPFRQNIAPLCDALISSGHKVQIETNGTLYQKLHDDVDIICSPKTVKKYAPLRSDVLESISALKFIISERDPLYSYVPDVGQGDSLPIYVQPMDEYDEVQNAKNLAYTIKLAQQYHYRLSIQLHKVIGVA